MNYSRTGTAASMLVGSGRPIYCSERQMIVLDGELLYVERIERLFKDVTAAIGPEREEPHPDYPSMMVKTRDTTRPETIGTHGINPCLVHLRGRKQPIYFDSGWTTVTTISQDFHGDD